MRAIRALVLLVGGLLTAVSGWALAGPESLAIVSVTRESGYSGMTCDMGLYVENQLAARLAPEQSVSLDLPAGKASLAVGPVGEGYCRRSIASLSRLHLDLRPGQILHLRVVVDNRGYSLRND